MAEVLVATESGCVVYRNGETPELELPGREVGHLASGQEGGCIAVVDQREVWQRSPERVWSKLAIADIPLQSVLAIGDTVFAGGMNEATVLRMTLDGGMSILNGFEDVLGRSQWFAGGPPLGVRSLAATCDAETLIAAVHVGGMPRSEDGGNTWKPTIPVMFDVHEVRTHPYLTNFVAAAAAVGLCVSFDSGKKWEVIAEGLEITNSLAVAVLETEVLFSVQDGPFAKRSQVWRWPIAGGPPQPVRRGLPEWLEGKVDTAHIASGQGRAAICDGGGHVWLAHEQTSGWLCIAEDLGYTAGLLIL
ncbi:MAG: WD40/YVTN/BNR-like repeat-containing protein [Janthinobacterium lividum]